jgi:hypothetical protein
MKVMVEGGSSYDLNQKNYKAEGREGRIYIIGNTVFKIYINKNEVIDPRKVKELILLDRPNIIRPTKLVRDTNNDLVGFTMNLVPSNVPLVKLFTTSFQTANKIKPEQIVKLVEIMKDTYQFIHDKGCLVVDGNEMNYLVADKKFNDIYFLDVDSFKTPTFPPTAYHPLTRDYTSQDFTMLTDWYTFGIISFQMFVGIHPYRGKHPSIANLEQRVIQHISVFNKGVSYPKTVRDFSYIPSDYLKWYEQLFEHGKRIPPPAVAGLLNITPVAIRVVQATNSFIITFVREYKDPINWFSYFNGYEIARTDGSDISVGKVTIKADTQDAILIHSPNKMIPLIVEVVNEKLKIYRHSPTREEIRSIDSYVDEIFVDQNHLYAVREGKLMEIVIEDSFQNPIAYVNQTAMWDIMPESSHIYDGVIISSVLGKPYITVPFHLDGKSMCSIKPLNELTGYTIVGARRERNVVIIQARKGQQYDNLIFKFDNRFDTYVHHVISDVDPSELNFVVLDTGICIMINSDDSLMIFHSSPNSTEIKKIIDPDIHNDMQLISLGTRAGFYLDKKLYTIEMKKP